MLSHFLCMAIFLFSWLGFSLLLCLALVRAAARRRPQPEQTIVLPQPARASFRLPVTSTIPEAPARVQTAVVHISCPVR